MDENILKIFFKIRDLRGNSFFSALNADMIINIIKDELLDGASYEPVGGASFRLFCDLTRKALESDVYALFIRAKINDIEGALERCQDMFLYNYGTDRRMSGGILKLFAQTAGYTLYDDTEEKFGPPILSIADNRYVSNTAASPEPVLPHPKALKQKSRSKIIFGRLTWQVLSMEEDRALLITDRIIKKRPYNEKPIYTPWAHCDLRKYLNSEFYDRFSERDKSRILKTEIVSGDAQWFGAGDEDITYDKLFLLDISETVKYFGGEAGKSIGRIDDEYNCLRIAPGMNGRPLWWWLRSPGDYISGASYVSGKGFISVSGRNVTGRLGVRPALWLNLASNRSRGGRKQRLMEE